VNKEKITNVLLIITGIILNVIGINAFLTPAKLLTNGLAGIAVAVDYVFGINQGLLILLMNIPIFLYARKYVDKSFLVSSFINMFIYSFLLGATKDLYKYIVIDDIMIQSIFGGIMIGAGIGLIFKANSTVGGMDILTAVIKIKYNIPLGVTFLAINVAIVCIGGVLFGAKLAMYTIISMYITSKVLEVAKDCFNKKKFILLVSDKNEEIAQGIMEITKRGVTFLEAEGGYTNQKRKLLYCIISTNQVAKIKELIYKKDNKAFVSINNVDEVRGGGFKTKLL